MQKVASLRLGALIAAAILTMAAGFATTARYVADAPGANLRPVDGAERVVQILQGNQHILWTSLTGSVTSVTVRGWPVTSGDVELGGALSITQPDTGDAGVIDAGDKPMSVEFEVRG